MRSFKTRLALSACALAGTALLGLGAARADDLASMIKDPAQWVVPGGNFGNQRYSTLTQINTRTAKNLRPVWTFSTGVLRGHEGGPLVIGDMMYFSTPFPNKVFALDLAHNGRIVWSYTPKQDPNVIPVMCCDTVNRGVSYSDGMIFLHQADTTLVALDAQTGKVDWSVKTGNAAVGETGTSAPFVFKDKVYVGISGGEFGIRGRMMAYNIKDGSPAWTAYSSGPDKDMLFDPDKTMSMGKPVGADSSLKTWTGQQWMNGGGATWGWISFDPDTNTVFYGSGNPGTWNPTQRPGDNKWSMTVFARDADTGVAKWVYQMTPHDQWDYDGINEMILANVPVHGKMTHALVHFDRNGFAYVLNRDTGELLEANKYDPAVNWATHVDLATGRPEVVSQYAPGDQGSDHNTQNVCPAALGSKDEQPASYSPMSHMFYVPTNHVCMDYEPFKVSYTAGQPFVGATLSMYPPKGQDNLGNFIAYDVNSGTIKWSDPEPFSVWSGALSTAGGVVAYGTLDGQLKVVDQKSGKLLYSFKTPSGIIGNVNTYEHDGKQYLAVLSGVGGWAGIGMAAGLTEDTAGLGAVGAYKALSSYTQLGGVLTVFSL
ncbi:MAG: methanol/ethanol family PQQ-dependent dehydrogenase [Acidocella sp.]|nr:methanol/ethanol family PQQ-dependent dehydrogenase [Acidocella sp.]